MSAFKALSKMVREDKDIILSANQMVECKTHPAGGLVTVGIDKNTFNKLTAAALGGTQYHVLLLIVNAEQLQEAGGHVPG